MRNLAIAAAALAAAAGLPAGADRGGKGVMTAMELTSPAFSEGRPVPARNTCDGEDVSPLLAWTGVPEGTGAFALVMEDPDAPPGTWVHWTAWNVPASATGLQDGLPREPRLRDGTVQGRVWGVKTFSRTGYWGPCPPPGKPHRYVFTLHALAAAIELDPAATRFELAAAMEGKVLATATLTGTYRR